MLEKPKLFIEAKEFWLVVLLFGVLLACRLGWLYHSYREFVQKPFYFTTVEVLQQYKKIKNDRSYTTLRLYSADLDLNFFTLSYSQESLRGKSLRLKLYPNEQIGFGEYLSTAFIRSDTLTIKPKASSSHHYWAESILQQHQSPIIGEFYQAIFLAIPLGKRLREKISALGVSHLVALSGFHLGILWTVLFLFFRMLYRPLQRRYFPYRFDLIDVGFLVLLILGYYVYFVEAPASLLRSYVMMILGWVVLILGIELLRFDFLLVTAMVILLIFPKLLLSLAFWFSVMGVFYIFLLLYYFQGVSKIKMSILISFGLFILMMPLVHLFFPLTTPTQLLSPLLSLLFSLFYPLSLGLHLVGWGDLLDPLLLKLFALSYPAIEVKLSYAFGIGYLILSIGAIYWRRIFYLLFLWAFGFVGWIFIMVML